jgi:hypothetical protein
MLQNASFFHRKYPFLRNYFYIRKVTCYFRNALLTIATVQ